MNKYKIFILSTVSTILIIFGVLILTGDFKINYFFYSIILLCIGLVIYFVNKK